MSAETLVCRATPADLVYIDHLRKREGDAVGFIPMARYEMEVDGRRKGSLYVAWDNGDPTGFIYATHSGRGASHIIQVAIQDDARRMERATLLTDAITNDGLERGSWLVSLRCADDLEANDFWGALDFSLEAEGLWPKSPNSLGKAKRAINRRGRRINVWQKEVAGLWVPMASGAAT